MNDTTAPAAEVASAQGRAEGTDSTGGIRSPGILHSWNWVPATVPALMALIAALKSALEMGLLLTGHSVWPALTMAVAEDRILSMDRPLSGPEPAYKTLAKPSRCDCEPCNSEWQSALDAAADESKPTLRVSAST